MTWALVTHMDDRFENELCFFLQDGPLAETYRERGFHVTVLDWRPVRTLHVAWQLYRLLRSRKHDIIKVYGYKANMLARWVAWAAQVRRYITAQRSIDLDRRPWHSFLDRITSPLVDLYISNSQAAADLLVSRERVPPEKVVTIPNGIDSDKFYWTEAGRTSARAALEIAPDELAVAVVANLRPMKGHLDLVQALAKIGTVHKNVHLFFAGEGPCRTAIEERVGTLGLGGRVHLLGQRTDIPEILGAMDLFVLPSYWEGMPGSVMEAMAAGLPVISTDVGGIPELVLEGVTGNLVQPGDVDSLADRLRRLLSSREEREAMGAAGRLRIKTEFSLTRMVRKTESAYETLVSGDNARPL